MTNKQARAILINAAENVLGTRYEDEPLDLYYALKLAIDALDAVRWRDPKVELPDKRQRVVGGNGDIVYLNDDGIWRYDEDDFEAYVPSWIPIPHPDKSIPIKAPFDMWIRCPTCGYDLDFEDEGGFEPDPDDPQFDHWVGPSFCPKCGQAFDLSEINEQNDKSKQEVSQ